MITLFLIGLIIYSYVLEAEAKDWLTEERAKERRHRERMRLEERWLEFEERRIQVEEEMLEEEIESHRMLVQASEDYAQCYNLDRPKSKITRRRRAVERPDGTLIREEITSRKEY